MEQNILKEAKRKMKEEILAKTIKIFIENLPAETIGTFNVTDIARKFKVSLSYLSRSFHKYNRCTPHEYLELYKIIRFDCTVGMPKKITVKDTLAVMKIENVNHFIKRYKIRMGATPGKYCKKYRQLRKETKKRFAALSKRK